jgi:hypothetical protein
MRTVKTTSGATAVQVVWSSRRGSRAIEHLGSAHDEAELEALKAAARQGMAAGQLELDLGPGSPGPSGPLPITSSRMGHLVDALERAYRGPREYRWTRVPVRPGRRPGRGYWLLARRSLHDPGEISYYACYGPRRASTADLAWVAGSRWRIEECFGQAKGEAGLDHYQVRTWRAWHAHITLSMLALARLAATRARAVKGEPAPATRA